MPESLIIDNQQPCVKSHELGISESEVQELFNVYEIEDDVLYTIGVEIECYGLDKAKFAELCRTNRVDLQSLTHCTPSNFPLSGLSNESIPLYPLPQHIDYMD